MPDHTDPLYTRSSTSCQTTRKLYLEATNVVMRTGTTTKINTPPRHHSGSLKKFKELVNMFEQIIGT